MSRCKDCGGVVPINICLDPTCASHQPKVNETDNERLAQHMLVQGYRLEDVPYTPILPEWERYPIVRALRQAEASTNVKYVNTGEKRNE